MQNLQILAIETATPQCSVALCSNESIYLRQELAERKHTECILPMVQDCLQQASLELSEVDLIAFGQGPGSFMGVRLAATVAQGLAFSIGCPVVAVSSLRVLAQTAYQQFGFEQVLAGWDARMQEFYWGGYQLDQQQLMQVALADALTPPAEFHLETTFATWPAVGNAWSVYAVDVTAHDCFPQADALITLARAEYEQGHVIPAEQARPIYLRSV